MQHLFDRFYKA